MTDEPSNDTKQSNIAEAWREAGAQMESLGKSLANAFRAAWNSEENREHVQALQNGLESLATQVETAIKETIASPDGQKVKSDMANAAEQARLAIVQAGKELQKKLKELSE